VQPEARHPARSVTCTTQVVIVRAPADDVDLPRGGSRIRRSAPVVSGGRWRGAGEPTLVGNRYADVEASGPVSVSVEPGVLDLDQRPSNRRGRREKAISQWWPDVYETGSDNVGLWVVLCVFGVGLLLAPLLLLAQYVARRLDEQEKRQKSGVG
jgi:hypothetical protein